MYHPPRCPPVTRDPCGSVSRAGKETPHRWGVGSAILTPEPDTAASRALCPAAAQPGVPRDCSSSLPGCPAWAELTNRAHEGLLATPFPLRAVCSRARGWAAWTRLRGGEACGGSQGGSRSPRVQVGAGAESLRGPRGPAAHGPPCRTPEAPTTQASGGPPSAAPEASATARPSGRGDRRVVPLDRADAVRRHRRLQRPQRGGRPRRVCRMCTRCPGLARPHARSRFTRCV